MNHTAPSVAPREFDVRTLLGRRPLRFVSRRTVEMTYGGADRDATLEQLRWFGPGATLVGPNEWRPRHVETLRAMLAEAEAGSRQI